MTDNTIVFLSMPDECLHFLLQAKISCQAGASSVHRSSLPTATHSADALILLLRSCCTPPEATNEYMSCKCKPPLQFWLTQLEILLGTIVLTILRFQSSGGQFPTVSYRSCSASSILLKSIHIERLLAFTGVTRWRSALGRRRKVSTYSFR